MAAEKYLGKAGIDPATALITGICCAKKLQKVAHVKLWPDTMLAFVARCHRPHMVLVALRVTCLQMQLVHQAIET